MTDQTLYRSFCSSRRIGLIVSVFTGLLVVGGFLGLLVTPDPVSKTFVGLILIPIAAVFVPAVSHVLKPRQLTLQIDKEKIFWTDWFGFGSRTHIYLLDDIVAIVEPNEDMGYIRMRDGSSIHLPGHLIDDWENFVESLQKGSSEIKRLSV
jgi:hypothetical protein